MYRLYARRCARALPTVAATTHPASTPYQAACPAPSRRAQLCGCNPKRKTDASPCTSHASTSSAAAAFRTQAYAQPNLPPTVATRLPVATAAAAGPAAAVSGSHGSPPAPSPSPPSLEEWVVRGGGAVHGVALRCSTGPSGALDRQLVATTDHPAGALLIAVPRHLQIRYDNLEAAAAAAVSPAAAATDPAATSPSPTSTATSSPTAAADVYGIPTAAAAAVVSLFARLPVGSASGAPAWQLRQALGLLAHLAPGPASPLAPYLAALPGLARGVPSPRVAMLLGEEAVGELQYGSLVGDVRNQQYWLRRVAVEVLGAGGEESSEEAGGSSGSDGGAGSGGGDSDTAALVRAAFPGLRVDEGLLGWAVAVAMSRSFGLSRFRTHTCVPLVDMANHTAPRAASNAEIRSGPGGEVCMYAKRQIRAGEELSLTYGSHDNANLLLSYGFTLQPNPYDAFWFDVDLDTIQSLTEGMGGGEGGGLAPWQLRLLRDKLGLGPAVEGAAEGAAEAAERGDGEGASGGGGSIRVFLSAADPAAPRPGSAGGEEDGAGTAAGSSSPAVTAQPVDARLLAALRIATLQDEAWYGQLAGRSAEQLGAWGGLLARQQEIDVMRLLAALVTALYTSFPTTIQQDRKLLAAASTDLPPTAAATPPSPSPSPASSSPWPLRPHDLPPPNDNTDHSTGDPAAAAAVTSQRRRDLAEALRFRLGLKRSLEGCLQRLLGRAKQLDQLQRLR